MRPRWKSLNSQFPVGVLSPVCRRCAATVGRINAITNLKAGVHVFHFYYLTNTGDNLFCYFITHYIPRKPAETHASQMKLTTEQAFQQGFAAHKRGKLQEAERLYRAILQTQPHHPDANHNLGILAASVNKAEAALTLFKTALEANPKIDQFWLSYINALITTKKFDDARQVLAAAQQAGVTAAKLRIFEGPLQFEPSPVSHIPQQELGSSRLCDQDELLPAIELREVGKYKEAQKWLSDFIDGDSANPEALSLLSQVLLLDKKESESERVLITAASISPELPSVYRNQARLLLKQSKTAEALEMAQMGCEQSPGDSESLLLLAACLRANQRDTEALHIIEKVLAAEPNYAEAYANRALIKVRAKDTLGALKDAEATVSIKPHLSQIWALLGSLHYQNGNLSNAIEAQRRACINEPKNPAFMILLGEFLRQDKKADEAIPILAQATELVPKDANAWTSLGVAFQQEERIADAKTAYEKALALNPNSATISSNLGVMAKDAEEWESALRYFEQALEIEPNLAEAHSNLGITLQELGRLDEAEASHTEAIALKPNYAEAHSNLGNTLKEMGQLDEAQASYRQAITLKPDYAEAHSNLGNTLAEMGRLGEAQASYRQAITLKPDYAEAHSNLGNTLKEMGRLDEAEVSYRQAIAFKPDSTTIHHNLGVLFFEGRRYDQAVKHFELSDTHLSKLYAIKCSYLQDEASTFSDKYDLLVSQGEINAVIGSLGIRSEFKYGTKKANPFCSEPLKYVVRVDLREKYDFEKIFIQTARDALADSSVSYKAQGHLANGVQTAGDIFVQGGVPKTEIENIIRAEIEKYRAEFKDSDEGFIQKWPTFYNIQGWLICMQSGGKLYPHMHDRGWITGSIYINVPPKSKADSGNLVLCLSDEDDLFGTKKKHQSSVDVVTGELCLFPSSLHHYTIPFDEKEERIVLAFDVIPKEMPSNATTQILG